MADVKESLFLAHRLAGQTYAEFLEYLVVYLAEHHRRMSLTALRRGGSFRRVC